MPFSAFICFLVTALALIGVILLRLDRKPLGRRLFFSLILALFLFAGFRSQEINSDTASYASYAVHFQTASVSEDPEIADRLEWGFRVFLRLLALALPAGNDDGYPLYVNLTVALLGGLLLCRAASIAHDRAGLLVLVYMGSLFFVHQFAIVRLGLAVLLFLNYFISSYTHRKPPWIDVALLFAGCAVHYTVMGTALVLFGWELILRLVRSPTFEVVLFGLLVLAAALLGVIAEHVAPLMLSGYHLSLVVRGTGTSFSPKGMAEVSVVTVLFILHLRTVKWARDRRSIRWRVLFYLTLLCFLVELISGVPFVGRFRILISGLFIIQSVMITGGVNFGKRTTWLVFISVALSVAAQVISISRDDTWFVLVERPAHLSN